MISPFWQSVDETILQLCQDGFELAQTREQLAPLARKILNHIETTYPRNPGKNALLKNARSLAVSRWKNLPDFSDESGEPRLKLSDFDSAPEQTDG